MTVSGTNDWYLRKEIALPIAFEKMEPNLFALDMITAVPENDASFVYQYNDTSITGDANKEKPALHQVGGDMPEINFAYPSTASELLKMRGFSVRIPRQVVRNASGKNEIIKDYEKAGVWLADWLNVKIISKLTAKATTPTWSPTAEWSNTATATPVEDLRLLKYQMRREGYPYRMTNAIVHTDNLAELEGYLVEMDISAAKQERMYGVPGGNGDSIYVPIAGCTVTGVDSGMTEGNILALDKNNPGAEFHHYTDKEFGTARIVYTTMENGQKVTKNVQNFGIHFDQFREDGSKDTILQFWIEGEVVVTDPYAYLYDTGI